jgi:L,D-transpeptidase YcbB
MISCFFTRRLTTLQSVSLAIVLACSATAGSSTGTFAGSGEPANRMFKQKAAGTVTSNTTTSHSQGSGGKATTVTEVVSDGTVSPFLLPDSVASIQAAADKYATIVSSGGWPKVPGGKLKKGSTGKSVAALNRRLHIEGYLRAEATQGEYAETFTTATEDALKRFQRNHGLGVSGAIDGPTINQLNVPAERRLATIRANIPRIAEYSKDLGSRYVVVNIPAQQIETVSDGRVYSRHNAIVGRPSRPTPVVMTPLTIVRFNPYWNAPPSIVEKDILPRMVSGSASRVMADMNMKVFQGVGGPEINPDKINWRRAVVDNYHFRQEPGGTNAMATAKIEFNSPFGIYLHDTPEPHLFNTWQRLYSSGCVRVENVATFINWILQGQDGINSGRIAELADTKERLDTPITSAPQLRVAYLTAWPTRDGVAAFRPDVYELDGTGFVLGQPLPVGETSGGKRYVLKPIPRSQQAVDEAEAFGFASLFKRTRNSDKEDAFASSRASSASDSLISTPKKTKVKISGAKIGKDKLAKAKGKSASAQPAQFIGSRNPDKESGSLNMATLTPDTAKKKPGKKSADKKSADKKKLLAAKTKPDDKAKSAKAKKVLKTDEVVVAAKKPDAAKDAAVKKKPAAAAKAPASCKDGKPAEGCKAPDTAKKPATKPEKTASAAN